MSVLTLNQSETVVVSAKRQQWQGAITATLLQGLLFIPLYLYTSPLLASLVILAINIPLAASYKNLNPYITGARWASFLNLGWMSFARHNYWYDQFNESFDKLKDYDKPIGAFQQLSHNSASNIISLLITSALIIVFYSFTPRWTEWHGQWERARWSLLSGSLGMQAIIIAVSFKPNVTTITLAVLFASVISPILRRQVRFNHILFTMLVPMLSLNNGLVSITACFISGLLFMYYVAVERSLTLRIASFSFALSIVFFTAFLTQLQDWGTYIFGRSTIGIIALIVFALTITPTYWLIFKQGEAVAFVRRVMLKLTPKKIKNMRWWQIRSTWVDQEVHCRVNGLYKSEKVEKSLGTIIFGQRTWARGSESFTPVVYPRVNVTAAVIAVPFYAIWMAIEWALNLTNIKSAILTNSLLLLGLGIVLSVPVLLYKQQKKDLSYYSKISRSASLVTIVIFSLTSLFYIGFSLYTLF